ncbi:hypothetical protein [Prochlorococcus marinus]|uniref:hypothetical protein n=1 Tax=Prochlorococcus marinus TaxID=1219 RepID=UPI001FD7AF3D|nr:hypothetical protein [Prochlorococcus marinus]
MKLLGLNSPEIFIILVVLLSILGPKRIEKGFLLFKGFLKFLLRQEDNMNSGNLELKEKSELKSEEQEESVVKEETIESELKSEEQEESVVKEETIESELKSEEQEESVVKEETIESELKKLKKKQLSQS